MRAYRLARRPYTDLDGEGARLAGGRWNSEGIAMVYLASSASLALIEQAVHFTMKVTPPDLILITVEISEDIGIETLHPVPSGWDRHPESPAAQSAGDSWIRSGRSAILLVPSVVVPIELNVLMNPAHPDAARVVIVSKEPFPVDSRLHRRK